MSDFTVKEFKDPNANKESKRVIWTSERVKKVEEAIIKGYEVPNNPFYEGDLRYRKGDLVFEYTDLEAGEIEKCATDIVYFANTYCQVMTDDGIMKIKLRNYQERLLKSLQENRFNVVLAPRQIGKTIISAIFLSWYLLFQFDKNALLMSNKGATTKEIMDKTKVIFEGLPFFLKPGVRKKDIMSMIMDNGCRLIGQNTTKTGGISFTIHLLFLDEFAHIPENILNEFYGNVYPTLSSSKISRIIITSTPNGFNLFQQIYQAAVDKENEYTPFRVDWWEVPGRDEAWKIREIANLGSEEEFNKQYGCQFLSSERLLLDSDELKKIQNQQVEYVFREFDPLDDLGIDYSNLKWHPDFDIDEIKKEDNFYFFVIDIGEGVKRDYSIFNIFRLEPMPDKYFDKVRNPDSIMDYFTLNQVGMFRSNVHSIDDFSKILYTVLVEIFDQENLKLVVEYNTYGEKLFTNLRTLYPMNNDFDEETITKFHHRLGAIKKSPGVRLHGDKKTILCQDAKIKIRDNRILINEPNTINEAKMFSRTKTGTYKAQNGHDDAFMTVVLSSAIFDTNDYNEFVEEFFDMLNEEEQAKIENALDNYGLKNDGMNIYDIVRDDQNLEQFKQKGFSDEIDNLFA